MALSRGAGTATGRDARPREPSRDHSLGPGAASSAFTLLEMLVVLALTGLLIAVVAPRLVRIYQAVRASMQRHEVIVRIDALGYRAHAEGLALVLGGSGSQDLGEAERAALKLPSGWTVEAPKPIRYLPSGACSGGAVVLRYASVTYHAELTPPLCQVHLQ